MIVNHILAASRIPYILEQKGIEIDGNLLTVNIDDVKGVAAQLYKTTDIIKFDGWEFIENKLNKHAGIIKVEFEGINFSTWVRVEELEKLNIEN